MIEGPIFQQADLMLRILPYVAQEKDFALKGGTAINFFIQDMPRLSVDVDLTYLPLEPWEISLQSIGAALGRIAQGVQKALPKAQVQVNYLGKPRRISKLFIREEGVQIKIEPNEVLRGCVYPPQERSLSRKAEESFGRSASITILSAADLYGGKLCAALDRQHPRDFFDLKVLLEGKGITEEIRKAFVVYLASCDRPMHELLDPKTKDMQQIFETEFLGMALVPVTCQELDKVRKTLIKKIKAELTPPDKRFLLSLKEGNPEWSLLGLPGADQLPGMLWKLTNIRKMDKHKHAQAVAKLKKVLGL